MGGTKCLIPAGCPITLGGRSRQSSRAIASGSASRVRNWRLPRIVRGTSTASVIQRASRLNHQSLVPGQVFGQDRLPVIMSGPLNPRLAKFPHSAGFSINRRTAAANACRSSGGQRMPSRPARMISRLPGASAATTARPLASTSRVTHPKVSDALGFKKRSADAYAVASASAER